MTITSLAAPAQSARRDDTEKRRRIVQTGIAVLSLAGIALHLVLRFGFSSTAAEIPLYVVLSLGGVPLVAGLLGKLVRGEFGSDLLAGISIVTSVVLHEYLAGALVVLMLSGGEALEAYAARNASSVLKALSNRMPATAQRKEGGRIVEVPLLDVRVGDLLMVFPHALCPVDGTVVEGHGAMDESYLTGEPYTVSKAPGTAVLSGAINGSAALTIRCDRPAEDSRYAKIMQVMRDAEERRPHLRRLGDQLGAWYTPAALVIAVGAWLASGNPGRFLAVLVVATPCPLLIAIPVAIIGSISLAARHGIIIKDPAVLEGVSTCTTAIFDKTGTLTYGRPTLTETFAMDGFDADGVLGLVAGIERYSKHPLAVAILSAADEAKVSIPEPSEVHETPGEGLKATTSGRQVHITGRKQLATLYPALVPALPPAGPGMECVVVVDSRLAAVVRFRDEPRAEGVHFIRHLTPKHHIARTILLSGDREEEVQYLAGKVGIREVYASQSPEQKLEFVREETKKGRTLFLGDGINDAPALTAASVGLAFGHNSDVTGEAADAVILDSSLGKVDVLFHIARRMRAIALQSAAGGMALSIGGMILASAGLLTPVAGAVTQEVIDVLAVLNALRAALPPAELSDF
jgi:heavy metal translocating P-type ATPase